MLHSDTCVFITLVHCPMKTCHSSQIIWCCEGLTDSVIFLALIDRTASDRWQGTREGEWHTAKGPRTGLEPGDLKLLQQGLRLWTWDACSTYRANWCPSDPVFRLFSCSQTQQGMAQWYQTRFYFCFTMRSGERDLVWAQLHSAEPWTQSAEASVISLFKILWFNNKCCMSKLHKIQHSTPLGPQRHNWHV